VRERERERERERDTRARKRQRQEEVKVEPRMSRIWETEGYRCGQRAGGNALRKHMTPKMKRRRERGRRRVAGKKYKESQRFSGGMRHGR